MERKNLNNGAIFNQSQPYWLAELPNYFAKEQVLLRDARAVPY